MTLYRAFGLTIASAIPLPSLPLGVGEPAVTVSAAAIQAPAIGWFEIWPPEGTAPRVRAAHLEDSYCIEYEASSRFLVSGTADAIAVDIAGCGPNALQHRLLDQVLPLALSLRHAVLHASVASAPDGACAFIGPAGTGKSTLALACVDNGWTVAADDAALVRAGGRLHGRTTFTVTPSYAGVRVLRAGGGKERITRGVPFDDREVPLAAVWVVDAAPAPVISATRLSSRDAAVAILGQMFRLEQRNRSNLERELAFASAVGTSVPVFRLAYPRDGRPDAVIAEVRRQMVSSATVART